MSGLLTTRRGKRFAFRKWDGLWLLWPAESDPTRGPCHKYKALPPGEVETFSIDTPPRMVSYLPVLGY